MNGIQKIMKIRIYIITCLVSITWSLNPPKTLDGINLLIKQIEKDIDEESKLWAEEKLRDEESYAKKKKNYEAFEKEKRELKTALVFSKNKISAVKDKIKLFKAKKTSAETRLKNLNKTLLSSIIWLEQNVKTSIPYGKDKRVEQIQLLVSDVRKQKIETEEAFNRLWNILRKEINMGGDAEVYQGLMKVPGGKDTEVKYMRLGKQILLYANAAGNHLGVMSEKKSGEWEWVHTEELDFRQRSAIRKAVGVAQGKEIPGFTLVPFWKSSLEEGE